MSTTHLFQQSAERAFALEVVNVGLACCALEFVAALDLPDGTLVTREPTSDAEIVSVLVVSGTVTTKTAPAVRAAYDALPEPKRVVSFGSCSNSGGPYWDSPAVVAGVEELVPVDVFVPGCPPRPEAVLDGLRVLDRIVAEQSEAIS